MTPHEQATFQEHCANERTLTLQVAGLSEDDLTDEQEIALTRYLSVSNAVYLALYGPLGPRGADLREETQAEAAARRTWEEALKTPDERLQEQVRYPRIECGACKRSSLGLQAQT